MSVDWNIYENVSASANLTGNTDHFNREGSHPTSTKRVGRSVGGGQKGLQSAAANLTGNADHLNREGSHPTSTKRVERSVGAGGQKLRLLNKPEPVFFLGE